MSRTGFAKCPEIFISSLEDRVKGKVTKDLIATKTKEAIKMNDQIDGTGRSGC